MIGESGGGATGVRLSWQLSPGATNHVALERYVALQCSGRSAAGESPQVGGFTAVQPELP
jgi:hypothetical protein